MRRRAVLQRIEQEAELGALVLGADLQRAEHLLLHVRAVDPDRTATELDAVEHHVVGLGAAAARVGLEPVLVAVLGAGERVMRCDEALVFLVVLEAGEVDHPQRAPAGLRQPVLAAELAVADLHAQRAERVGDDLGTVGAEEDQIAVLRAAALDDGSQRGIAEVLDDRALQTVTATGLVVDLDVGEPLGAVDLDELGIAVDLAARHLAAAGHAQRRHPAVGQRGGLLEHLELDIAHHVGQLGELHGHAQVGLVGAVQPHRFVIGHDREGRQLDLHDLAKDGAHHLLEERADLFLAEEAGFAVDLRELGLAVGAQVLVAEALGDLVVAVEAGHHQQLLEQLRRLRQREELAGMHARRHQVVARAFGRALGQHRRLDVDEAAAVEVLAHRHRDLVAQHQVLLHLRPAQVQHPMSQPRDLGQVVVVELERNRHRRVEDRQRGAQDLDLARLQVGVGGALGALAHQALDPHAVFVADLLGAGEHLGTVGVAHDLHQPLAVAQVDEDHAAMVAAAVDPAKQGDGLADVAGIDPAGIVGTHLKPLSCEAAFGTKAAMEFGGEFSVWRRIRRALRGRRGPRSDERYGPAAR